MARRVFHVSESEIAATDLATLLARVQTGAEIIIEKDKRPVAIIRSAEPIRRTISECIAMLPEDSSATVDPDFAKDVESAIESHREALTPPAWD